MAKATQYTGSWTETVADLFAGLLGSDRITSKEYDVYRKAMSRGKWTVSECLQGLVGVERITVEEYRELLASV